MKKMDIQTVIDFNVGPYLLMILFIICFKLYRLHLIEVKARLKAEIAMRKTIDDYGKIILAITKKSPTPRFTEKDYGTTVH